MKKNTNKLQRIMEVNKYELTDETIEYLGHTLHRIKALKDFGDIKKGDLGGFIEKEANLSQNKDCWVGGNAKVFDNAWIYNNAMVFHNAQVFGFANVYDNAKVYGNAHVFDHACISGEAKVCEEAKVCGKACVRNNAEVFDKAKINGKAEVFDKAQVYGNAEVWQYAKVYGNAHVFDHAWISGGAKVCGEAKVCGYAVIVDNAEVKEMSDYMVFQNNWSSGRNFTWTKSNDMWTVGCFYGTGEELIEKAYKDSEKSGKMYEETVNYVKKINNLNKKPKHERRFCFRRNCKISKES